MFRQPPPTVIDPRNCECDRCESGAHAPEDSVGAWEALMALHYGDIPELINRTEAPFITYMDTFRLPVVHSLPEDCQQDSLTVLTTDDEHYAAVTYLDSSGRECVVELNDCQNPSEVRILLSS